MSSPVLSSHWCLVGNVGGIRSTPQPASAPGTHHYSGGTKVYCLPAQWGDGYEKIVAIGRHRGSKAFSCLVMPAKDIANWRAQVIYAPAVLRVIEEWCSIQGHFTWRSKAEVEKYLQLLLARTSVATEA